MRVWQGGIAITDFTDAVSSDQCWHSCYPVTWPRLRHNSCYATLRFNEHTPASGCGQPTPIINHVPTSKSVTYTLLHPRKRKDRIKYFAHETFVYFWSEILLPVLRHWTEPELRVVGQLMFASRADATTWPGNCTQLNPYLLVSVLIFDT